MHFDLVKMVTDPGIGTVLVTFTSFTTYIVIKFMKLNGELKKIAKFLKDIKKSDMKFRFKELDDFMSGNPFTATAWAEFKNTLMFSESVPIKTENDELVFENISETVLDIQCIVEPVSFFNEESLVTSRYNAKLIGAVPALLTGMGPLFTFMHIGEAFGTVDFSTQESSMASVNGLMGNMTLAATVSILAVGASLVFILTEKLLYTLTVKKTAASVISMLGKLFDSISSEKFLIELLKETKIQNSNTKNLLAAMPSQFKSAFDKSLTSILVPYLDNVLYGLNKVQEKIEAGAKKGGGGVDDLF